MITTKTSNKIGIIYNFFRISKMHKRLISLFSWYKSFTLVELLIVIVIIGILAVALIPRLIGAQWAARNAARKSSIQQLATALSAYANDNWGNYPNYSTSCIWVTWGAKCRPWFIQNGWTTGVWAGNDSLNILLLQYMSSLPRDPSPTRSIGEVYIYGIWANTAVHCDGAQYVYNKSRLARQPEKISPTTDEACSPGKRACCSGIGCAPYTFCVLQLD